MKSFLCARPKNTTEAEFYDACLEKGISITRKGWPDYACLKENGQFFVVEVKPSRNQRLKRHQMIVLRILAAYGIKAYRWSPDGGFIRIRPKDSLVPKRAFPLSALSDSTPGSRQSCLRDPAPVMSTEEEQQRVLSIMTEASSK